MKISEFCIRYCGEKKTHGGSLQNEVNCMNDSNDFQDAESMRRGNSLLPDDQCHSHLIQYLSGC